MARYAIHSVRLHDVHRIRHFRSHVKERTDSDNEFSAYEKRSHSATAAKTAVDYISFYVVKVNAGVTTHANFHIAAPPQTSNLTKTDLEKWLSLQMRTASPSMPAGNNTYHQNVELCVEHTEDPVAWNRKPPQMDALHNAMDIIFPTHYPQPSHVLKYSTAQCTP